MAAEEQADKMVSAEEMRTKETCLVELLQTKINTAAFSPQANYTDL
jgi:hypothetical protein